VSRRAGLAALLVALAAASGPAEARPSQEPEVAAASEDFARLQNEWFAAQARFRGELRAAKDAGKKRREWPEDPAVAFYPRFESLAHAGEGRAVLWMAENLRDAFVLSPRREAAGRLLALVEGAGTAPWIADVLEPLRILSRELDEARFHAFLEGLRAPDHPVRLRQEACLTLGTVLERTDPERALGLEVEAAALVASPDAEGAEELLARVTSALQRAASRPELAARARAELRTLVERWPGSTFAEGASTLLFRLENLCVGCPAPDFASEDVDGNAFRLSDYEGKVTLIDFWGFW